MFIIPFFSSLVIDYGMLYNGLAWNVSENIGNNMYKTFIASLNEEDKKFVEDCHTLIDSETDLGDNKQYEVNDYGWDNIERLGSLSVNFWAYVNSLYVNREELKNTITLFGNDRQTQNDINKLKENIEKYVATKNNTELYSEANKGIKKELSFAHFDYETIFTSYYVTCFILLLVITIILLITTLIANYFSTIIAYKITKNLRIKLFKKITQFNNLQIKEFTQESLISRSTNDLQAIQNCISSSIQPILSSPFIIIVGLVLCEYTSTSLSWIIIIYILIFIIFAVLITLKIQPKFAAIQESIDKINKITKETVFGLIVIKLFLKESNQIKKFNNYNKILYERCVKAYSIIVSISPFLYMMVGLIPILIIIFGAADILNNNLEIGSMVAFIAYAVEVISALLSLSIVFLVLPRANVSYKRIYDVLNTKTDNSTYRLPNQEINITKNNSNRLSIKNINYTCNNKIFDDLSLEINKNGLYILYGNTGSGKTTLLKLLLKLTEPDSGSIKINSVNIKSVSTEEIGSIITYAPQESTLFSGDVWSNTAYNPKVQDKDIVWDSLKKAHIDKFVENNGGLQYEIQQFGNNVSGGQKQRFSIARAFAEWHEIIIIDDCLNAIDSIRKNKILSYLRSNCNNKIIIYATNNVNNIKDDDNVIVLADGKIAYFDKFSKIRKKMKQITDRT